MRVRTVALKVEDVEVEVHQLVRARKLVNMVMVIVIVSVGGWRSSPCERVRKAVVMTTTPSSIRP